MTLSTSQLAFLRLSERYFAAETTEHEEAELLVFLSTPESDDAAFDEIKAVMGFGVVARRLRSRQTNDVSLRRAFARRWWRAVAAGVVLLLAVGATWMLWVGKTSDCMAYVNGRYTTDRQEVVHQMHMTLRSALSIDDMQTPDEQLHDLFSTSQTSQR